MPEQAFFCEGGTFSSSISPAKQTVESTDESMPCLSAEPQPILLPRFMKNDYEEVLGEKRDFFPHRGKPRISVPERVYLGEERGLPHRDTHTPAGTYSERGTEIG